MDRVDSLLRAGDTLQDRFRIKSVIGTGAYGVVYLAEDCRLDGIVWAIKEIREEKLEDEDRQEALSRFSHEVEILKSLNHTGIPKVVDSFSTVSCHYIVMEYVEGRTAEDILKDGIPNEEAIISWALKICQILEYIHSLEPEALIYRDLKPANIMINPRGRILLIDFGIARFYDPEKATDTVSLGTPGFSAPEQYGSAQSDVRSDIYALGASMYNLLTNEDLAQYNFRIPPVRTLNGNASRELEEILSRCLQLEPAKRFSDVHSLRSELEKVRRKGLPEEDFASTGTQSAQAPSGGQPRFALILNLSLAIISFGLMLYFIGIMPYISRNPVSLHDAVEKGNMEWARKMLKGGSYVVNEEDKNGYYPLYYAIKNRDYDMAELLIKHGADVNPSTCRFWYESTPLKLAIREKDPRMAQLLIASGADVNPPIDEFEDTLLIGAIENGDSQSANLLIEKGADIQVETGRGETALGTAIECDNREIVDSLISHGIDVNEKIKFDAPLIFVDIAGGAIEASFLHGGALPESYSTMPLSVAAWFGSVGVIETLIDKGAEIDDLDEAGCAPLHLACWENRDRAVQLLLSKGASVNRKSDNGWTPLHYAAFRGSLGAAKMLVAKGARLNEVNREGDTPLSLAKLTGREEMILFLEKAGGIAPEKDFK